MQARDPKSERPSGAAGRPAFGVGPIARVQPSPLAARAQQAQQTGYPPLPVARAGFGLPNLRRNVCPHFYMTGSRGAIPIQAPHLLKALSARTPTSRAASCAAASTSSRATSTTSA